MRVIISRRMGWAGHVACMGEINAYKILVRTYGGRRILGRPRCRWEDNITMDLREIEWKVVDWMHLAQDRESVVGSCEHSNEPLGSIKGREFLD
jgi:hypothetical protein